MTYAPGAERGKPRVGWMDALRGLAVMLVVLNHSLGYVHKAGFDFLPVLDPLSDLLNPARMPTMAFLSGLLLAPSLAKGAGPYLWGKVSNVAWPLLIWSVIYKAVWIAAEPFTGTPHSPYDLLAIAWAPEGHLWYLRDLFLFYALHLALARTGLPRTPLLLGTAVLAVALCSLDEASNNNGQWQRFWFLFAFFTLGGWLSERPGHLDALLARTDVRVAAALAAAAVIPATLLAGNIRYEWVSVPFTLGSVAMLALAAQALCRTPLSAPLRFLGRESLVVYVGHWLVVAVAALVVTRLAPGMHPTLMGLVVLGTGIGASAVGIHLIRAYPALRVLFSFPRKPAAAPGNPSSATRPAGSRASSTTAIDPRR